MHRCHGNPSSVPRALGIVLIRPGVMKCAAPGSHETLRATEK